MGKRRHGKPDSAGEAVRFSTEKEPVEAADVAAAVDRFVDDLVVETRRARTRAGLLARGEKRLEALGDLPARIPDKLQTTLVGSSGFPPQLQARFGDLRGIVITGRETYRATIAGAVHTARMGDGFAALFIAPQLALLIPEIGDVTLIRRQQVV